MKSNKDSITHLKINGQKILFLSREDWENLMINPVVDNISVAIMSSVERELPIANQYPEIYLGLGFSSPLSKWTSYVFLKIGEYFQRVHLERLTCKICAWQGMTANPMVVDSYLADGINQDHFTLMRYAERYPVLKCPQCDSSLPRHPIWIEYPVEE